MNQLAFLRSISTATPSIHHTFTDWECSPSHASWMDRRCNLAMGTVVSAMEMVMWAVYFWWASKRRGWAFWRWRWCERSSWAQVPHPGRQSYEMRSEVSSRVGKYSARVKSTRPLSSPHVMASYKKTVFLRYCNSGQRHHIPPLSILKHVFGRQEPSEASEQSSEEGGPTVFKL